MSIVDSGYWPDGLDAWNCVFGAGIMATVCQILNRAWERDRLLMARKLVRQVPQGASLTVRCGRVALGSAFSLEMRRGVAPTAGHGGSVACE